MPTYVDSPSAFGNLSTPLAVSNIVTHPYPWPNNGLVKVFELEFLVNSSNYSANAYGTTSGWAPNAYLVEFGPVTKVCPGVWKFREVYSEIPVTWVEKTQMSYTFPGLSGLDPFGDWKPYFFRNPVTLFAIATITHTYSVGASPTPDDSFLVTDDGNVVDYVGLGNPDYGAGSTSPASEPLTYNVSSEVRLLRGTMWEKVSSKVPRP